jgi:hypothetical protein
MPNALAEIRSLARSHTRIAIKTLAYIVRNENATAAARVAAATALLDRGWGKVPKPVAGGETAPPEPVHRIERVIVDPKHAER